MMSVEKKLQKISVFEGNMLPLGQFFTVSELRSFTRRELVLLFSIIAGLNTKLVAFPKNSDESAAPLVDIRLFRELYDRSFKLVCHDKQNFLNPASELIDSDKHVLIINALWNGLTVVSEPADAVVNFMQPTKQAQYKISNRIYTPLNSAATGSLANNKGTGRLENRKRKIIEAFNAAFFNTSAYPALSSDLADCNGKPLLGSSRYDEVFLPINLNPSSTPEDSAVSPTLYVSTWDQPSPKAQYEIQHFVTAMCLFGHSLVGFDEQNNAHPLVDPKYIFPEEVKIQDIDSEFPLHPYEQTMYQFLEHAFLFARNQGNNPTFHIHLPYTDYLLKMAKLLIKNIVTRDVFTQFLCLLTERAIAHTSTIESLGRKHGVKTAILSPLDALIKEEKQAIFQLFQQLQANAHSGVTDLDNKMENFREKISNIAISILEKFGLPSPQETKNKHCKVTEEEITAYCYNSLWSSPGYERMLWSNLHTASPINTVDDLLGASNAAMIATVSLNQSAKPGRINVCAIHTVEEKPIQQAYQKKSSHHSGEVFYMLALPPTLLHMGGNTHNLLFRLPHLTRQLTEKLTKRDCKEFEGLTSSDDDSSFNSMLSSSPESDASFPFIETSKDSVEMFSDAFYAKLVDIFSERLQPLHKLFKSEVSCEESQLHSIKVRKASVARCLSGIFFRMQPSQGKTVVDKPSLSEVNQPTL